MLSEDRGQGQETLQNCVRCQISSLSAEVFQKGQEDRRWPKQAGRLGSEQQDSHHGLLSNSLHLSCLQEGPHICELLSHPGPKCPI